MKHQLYDCGICGHWHPVTWDGDCRYDATRYGSPEDYAAQHGVSVHDIEGNTRDLDEVGEVD